MKKKIAYIELDTHPEIADAFFQTVRLSSSYLVDFFFSEKIHHSLPHLPATVVKIPNEILAHLRSGDYHHIVIGTAHRYFHIWQEVAENFPTSLIVHNLNFSKQNAVQLLRLVFKEDWKFRLKLLLKEKLWASVAVHRSVQRKWVLDKALERDDFVHLPLFCSPITPSVASSEKSVVVVPGAVEQTRRDYGKILDAMKYFKFPTEFIFLGKAQGSELKGIKNTLPFLPKHIELTYFTEKISKETFDFHLSRADVLWCPIQQETHFFSQKEYYGRTKISGNILDAIRSRKPIILPENYPCHYPFSFHESEDIEEQIRQLKGQKFDFSEFEIQKTIKQMENALNL